ncbi:hypothetical protein BWQ96_08159 [Gracilariopsis chorda]|uniref:Uncharacterized protein n=1 Tax=Gracilariopsis chorda TaxID=448386 RepID=A0A2V3IJ70_9FLOR|nr:hypothetical protein BWQ96_08159 [Gracilariopsis chorda]|eukprot:PXF42127.1 hypothetical protein BWQ96_08159 [Gracilariopsis chorda]
MESTTAANARATQAYIFAAFLTTVGVALFMSLVQTIRKSPLSEGISGIGESPWALSALADYFVGACFAALYVFLRDGPPVFCLSNKVFAVVFPFVGNFALLWYVAYLIVKAKDVTRGLLPQTVETPGNVEIDMRSSSTQKHPKTIGVAFFALLLWFAAVCFWASQRQSLQEGYRVLKMVKWAGFTFIDNLTGILFTVVFIIVREGEVNCITSLWILGLVFFGNGPTCLYVIHVAQQAFSRDVSFSRVLLSRSKSVSVHSVLEDGPTTL